MTEQLLSREDLAFLLHEVLQVENLTKFPRYQDHSRETFDDVIEVSRQLALDQFAPINRAGDLAEPQLEGETVHLIPELGPALTAYAEAGLVGATADEALGGVQLPHVIHQASFLWFQAANIAAASFPLLTTAAAHLLIEHGSPEQVETYARRMLSGEWFGTMCLSEPSVGSSLADVATVAHPQPDGSYRVVGQKVWISAGEHELSDNIVHLVLARTPHGPPGVRGLSLFIVPKWLPAMNGGAAERNDVRITGLNHKLGYRGIPNTLLTFGEDKGAVGHLVGREGDGLSQMFAMMNEARIGVGAGGAALASAAFRHALAYARERRQGRVPGHKNPDASPVPLVRHADVRRMLLASKSYAEGSIALVLFAATLLDTSRYSEDPQERTRALQLLDVLTPVVKSWPSEWGLRTTDLAIQVLGGAGYTRDHPVEQYYRDSRLNPIHEGTTGIQAIDLLGRKVRQQDGVGLKVLREAIAETATTVDELAAAAPSGSESAAELLEWTASLSAQADRLVEVTARVWAAREPERALADASTYLEACGHIVIAWMWLQQAIAAHGRTGAFYEGKRAAARYFLTRELPLADTWFDVLDMRDDLLVDLDDTCL